MPAMFQRQSELSFASFLFYAAGALIALSSLTIFRSELNPLNPVSMVVGAASFAAALTFFWLGRRVPVVAALVMLCVAASSVLLTVAFSAFEFRAMSTGLLFYTFLLYLVWFGPMWFARTFGYSWLAAYAALMFVRFSPEVRPFVFSLIVTAVILGELIGLYKRRLEASTLTDPLCSVWNKRGFSLVLARAAQDMQRRGRKVSVLFCDLDNFKQVNDQRGHTEGDLVLQRFAAALLQLTRPQDTVARIGGDEFVILMPDTSAAEAETAAQRLHSAVPETQWSYGIAELQPNESAEHVLARADGLMFAHKRSRQQGGRAALDSDT